MFSDDGDDSTGKPRHKFAMPMLVMPAALWSTPLLLPCLFSARVCPRSWRQQQTDDVGAGGGGGEGGEGLLIFKKAEEPSGREGEGYFFGVIPKYGKTLATVWTKEGWLERINPPCRRLASLVLREQAGGPSKQRIRLSQRGRSCRRLPAV